jgi:hypothetical protein
MAELDPIRVLIDKAPEVERLASVVEATVDSLYDAVSTLRQNWRTVVLNGRASAAHIAPTVDVARLPTWDHIRDLLTQWHMVEEGYRRTWDGLTAAEKERLPNLDPDVVGQT